MRRPVLTLAWRRPLPGDVLLFKLFVCAQVFFPQALIVCEELVNGLDWTSLFFHVYFMFFCFIYLHLFFGWLWIFARRVSQFEALSEGRVVLRYAPGLETQVDLPAVLLGCQDAQEELAEHFGFRLRVVIFLFPDGTKVRIFQRCQRTGIVVGLNAIVLAADHQLYENLRYELVQLYCARRRMLSPSLKSVGLAVWFQETQSGQPIDVAAFPFVLDPSLRLSAMANRRFFHDKAHEFACYMLAGSFTGYLIRNYGWDMYRRFFTTANFWNFRKRFRHVFGVNLETAEWEWRIDMVAMPV
jgi:hypothetical protein